jgi:phosphatidylglycerophosphate synthase
MSVFGEAGREGWWSALRRGCPSAVTFLGHALAVAWLLGAPLWLGVVGLACDAADGWCARRLGTSSTYGAEYDWAVDITVCAVVLARLGVLPVALLLVPLQVHAHLAGKHVSGRALASVVLALHLLLARAA